MISLPLGICRSCALKYTKPNASSLNVSPIRYFSARAFARQRFSPLIPPDPASLPQPTPAKHYRRTRKWLRRLFWTSAVIGGAYLADTYFYYSTITRSFRTLRTGLVIAIDYKINFRAHPPFAKSVEAVHARNAQRVATLLATNGGLYLKIGQAIAMQSAILPPEFQKMFGRMFDDAPQNTWLDVEKVIREDFGKSPEELFGVSFRGDPGLGVMERTARASASVAQVHWARLGDGREVAIKIQKREIATQVNWDLSAFRLMARAYSWWFDIPLYTLVPYVTERLMLETDFVNEAQNSERMKGFIEGESRLRNKVYIPKVHWEYTSKRVMTAEWIEGIPLWNKEQIIAPWQGGWRNGTPGCHGTPTDSPHGQTVVRIPQNNPEREQLKPARQEWRGRDGTGGLGLRMKDVMGTMLDLFSAQMFLWGWVHCDPHPGNIIVRRKPSGDPELVLIDHGLYIHMRPELRHQYALFWKSLMTFDNETIGKIVKGWGINAPDMFASMTLMRPYTGGDQSFSNELRAKLKGLDESERAFEINQHMRQSVREILGDEEKWPRELIFIGRNLRIVQANNQLLGSPVNRIKITGEWASRALVDSPDLSYSERFRNLGRHVVFRFVLFGSDLAFWFSRARQIFGFGGGMEDDIEKSMRGIAKKMGFEMQHSVFEG